MKKQLTQCIHYCFGLVLCILVAFFMISIIWIFKRAFIQELTDTLQASSNQLQSIEAAVQQSENLSPDVWVKIIGSAGVITFILGSYHIFLNMQLKHKYNRNIYEVNNQLQQVAYEKVQLAEQLSQQKALLFSIAEGLPCYIYWKDENLRYLGCNHEFANLLDISNPVEVIGKTDQDLGWSQEESEAFAKYDNEIMKTGIPLWNIRFVLPDFKQSFSKYLFHKIPLYDSKQQLLGILGFGMNVSKEIDEVHTGGHSVMEHLNI